MKDMSVAGDNPIRKPEDDVLGRSEVARSFAGQVLSLDASQGVVVGVLGPWASGKTSFVNLARAYWKEVGIPILDFNPWMFSGTDHLVNLFFAERSVQLPRTVRYWSGFSTRGRTNDRRRRAVWLRKKP